jgi:hypothetical protein
VTDRLVLDAGALIALERDDRAMWLRLDAAADLSLDVVAPAGAVAQVWRGTPKQARLARALKHMRLGEFERNARQAGELCRDARTSDPIDAAVVLNAAGAASVIVTSDLPDIRRLVRALPEADSSRISVVRA